MEDEQAAAAQLRELTRNLRRGNNAAWEQFHREFGPSIFRRLLGMTHGDHHLAEEALQHTYLRVARYVRPTDDAQRFASWIATVTRSAAADCFRSRNRFWSVLRRNSAEPALTNDSDTAVHAALEIALSQIERHDRALLNAKYLAGKSVHAIAEELSTSAKAIESRLTRARAALRTKILSVLATS